MTSPDPRQVRQVHQDLLQRWRRAMNLVGPGPLEPHMDDAEQAARLLQPQGRWADLGSGAGFPGIALAAWHPAAQLLLAESRRKRAIFLGQVIRASGLANAQVFHGRVEDLPAASFQGAIARAFARPPQALRQARRLLEPGGQAVLLLAHEPPPELSGMELLRQASYAVEQRSRSLAIFQRREQP